MTEGRTRKMKRERRERRIFHEGRLEPKKHGKSISLNTGEVSRRKGRW